MRIPFATDLKTRDGSSFSKDAQLKNCHVEVSGQSATVIKRASTTLTATIGAGLAQGGIAVGSRVFTINADVGLLT